MQGTTWEGGFREPGVIRFPGVLAPFQRITQMVGTMDLFPTVAELAGVPLTLASTSRSGDDSTGELLLHLSVNEPGTTGNNPSKLSSRNITLDGKSLVPLLTLATTGTTTSAPIVHTSFFYWRGNTVFAQRHGQSRMIVWLNFIP